MFFYLSKILSFLISPISWIFLLAITYFLTNKVKQKKRIIYVLFSVFYLFSNMFLVDEVFRWYEPEKIPLNSINETYDVAIVLGGGTTYDFETGMIDFHESGDRFFIALQLYKQKKVKKLLLSGGSGSMVKTEQKEAKFIKQYLMNIGVPEQDILIDSTSKNTYENAVNSKNIIDKMGYHKIMLITSAYHIPRAKACFKKLGMPVFALPVDYEHGPRVYYFDHLFLPQTKAFRLWETILHEWIGFISYKIAGYI
jgi:uncharacterized SAM-binding protein YcdF (DUF218 family)